MPRPRAERAATAARRAKLIEYRRRRRPYESFYKELGYSSANAASRDFSRALAETLAEYRASTEVYREEKLQQLDHLGGIANEIIETRHYVVTPGGKLVCDPVTGEPLLDDGPRLAAMDRLVKITALEAKLQGAYAPEKIEVLSLNDLDREEARLRGLLGVGDDEAGEDPADQVSES